MKKFLIAILILGIIGAGGYGVYHFYFENKSGSTERVSSTAENAVYVDSVSMITGFGSGTGLIDRFGGEVSPQATLEVKLDQDRKVKECFVKAGDEVKEGQRLFVYDTQEDEDKLAQAEIDIEKAKGDIELAEQSIAQWEKEKRNASDEEDQLMITTSILTAQNEIKQNEYEIKSKELEMESLRDAISNSTVTAEMAGIIQKISDPDSSSQNYYYGGGGDSAYITILAVGDFRVKGTVNEQNLPLIYVGMPMIVHSRVDDTLTWTGTITEIDTDNTEDEESNSMVYYGYGMDESGSSNYSFYVELDSSEGLILGQHVYMEQDAGQSEEKEGMWLEDYYIMQEDGKAYVWWANSSNTIEKHEIELGEYDEELMEYEVLGGLSPDDYITFPLDTISEGDPVVYNDFTSIPDLGTGMEDGMDMGGVMDMDADMDMDGMIMDDGMDMDDDMFMDDGMDDDMIMDDDMDADSGMIMDDDMEDVMDMDAPEEDMGDMGDDMYSENAVNDLAAWG